MPVHPGEAHVDERVVRRLLAVQQPELAGRPISRLGGGTDNTVFRVGDAHLARFPRTAEKVGPLRKELRWLPRLQPQLSPRIPVPVVEGLPGAGFALPWAVYEWIEGEEVSEDTISDWSRFGRDLAAFVARLHAVDLMGASRSGDLRWYRGGGLRPHGDWTGPDFAGARRQVPDLEHEPLETVWQEALRLPDPVGPHVWLHADLKPTNLLAKDGRLHAVIDFGALSIGHPDAEHAVVWDYPAAARDAFRHALRVDDVTWARAKGWALALGVNGVAEYWSALPDLGRESLRRVRAVAESIG